MNPVLLRKSWDPDVSPVAHYINFLTTKKKRQRDLPFTTYLGDTCPTAGGLWAMTAPDEGDVSPNPHAVCHRCNECHRSTCEIDWIIAKFLLQPGSLMRYLTAGMHPLFCCTPEPAVCPVSNGLCIMFYHCGLSIIHFYSCFHAYCNDYIISGVRLLNTFLALSKGLTSLDFILACFPLLRKESKAKKKRTVKLAL
jgi:hypothetical protein